jgi:hypothetical protein
MLMKIFKPFSMISGTTKLVKRIILITIILMIILGAYLVYPKRDNMGWNTQINEIINSPDFECDFDSDCEGNYVGCGCAVYGACTAKGYSSICILPMKGLGASYFCELAMSPPEDCICIDNKCMTI